MPNFPILDTIGIELAFSGYVTSEVNRITYNGILLLCSSGIKLIRMLMIICNRNRNLPYISNKFP